MDALLGSDPILAAVFKVALAGHASACVIWRTRRYRSILALAVLALGRVRRCSSRTSSLLAGAPSSETAPGSAHAVR